MSLGTPHKNELVKQVFSTIYLQMHSIMVHTGLYEKTKIVLWPEFAETANNPENVMVNLHKKNFACKNLYKKIPECTTH